ncbi:MAG: RluA family pseudouridine synthase [Kiritimatiellae bacterium]|nr:RluA family pseudouridine synthase [Kiritimatiellia bacterium]
MPTNQFSVRHSEAGITLIEFLAGRLGLSKKKAKALLDARGVFVGSRRVWMARHRLAPGDRVELFAPSAAAEPADRPAILLETPHYLIVDKPVGLVAVGPDSLEQRLRETLPCAGLVPVHRLDRDTSGCILFAKSGQAGERLSALFRRHAITKHYHAIVSGAVREESGTIRAPVDARRAVTDFRVLTHNRAASHLVLQIRTGRTHQIRRHLAAMGHPVLGDRTYGAGAELTGKQKRVPRQMLHAAELAFLCPFANRPATACAELPADFRQCLRVFGLA